MKCWYCGKEYTDFFRQYGSCIKCSRFPLGKKQIRGKNPTPRKCRGHKRPFEFEDNKCNVCGGVN